MLLVLCYLHLGEFFSYFSQSLDEYGGGVEGSEFEFVLIIGVLPVSHLFGDMVLCLDQERLQYDIFGTYHDILVLIWRV
jgi:hypothetical protein